MPLINTAGLTIFGDGSQWFWAMAGIFAIPITGYMIFSQLRGPALGEPGQCDEGLERRMEL